MAQRIIGLDIGSWSIKAMVLESSLRRMSFVALREHHLPVDAHGQALPGELPAAIKAVLQGLDVDVLSAGVPGVQVLLRELSLPFADEKRVTPVLGFQLESLLPRPLETMVYDWHVLRKTPEGAQLLCPAADKQWLDQWLGEVRAGGAEPRHLTLSTLAMGNLLPHIDLGEVGGRPVVVIDLGHRSTQLTLVKDGQVEAVRALSRGGHQVTQALARSLGLAYADAEHVKHVGLDLTGAVPDGVSPAEHAQRVKVAAQALEPILRELKMTLDAMTAQKLRASTDTLQQSVGAVILCGGMSRLAGMPEVISQVLDLPVLPLRPKGPVWEAIVSLPGATDVAIPAAGLALEHVRDGELHRVNLRRGDSAASDFGAVRARAGWIAAFIAVLLVIFFVRKAMRVSTLEEQQDQLAALLDEYGDKVLGDKPDPELEPKARFETVLDTVTSPPGSETDEVYPSMTAFKIFYEVTRIQQALNEEAAKNAEPSKDDEEPEEDEFGLPKRPGEAAAEPAAPVEKHQVELNSFAADLKAANQGSATIAGTAYDIVTVEGFATRLRAHPCFDKVDRQETRKTTSPNHPNWTDFTIKIEVKCPIGPATSSATRPAAEVAAEKPKAAADKSERAEPAEEE